MYFSPSFFDIMVYLTAHLVKEIHYLGPVFLHHMFPYERYMEILKSYIRNRAFPEECIMQGYAIEKALEWSINYIDPNNPICVPKSLHERKLIGVGVLGKMGITLDPKIYDEAHFLVLQQMSKVCPYVDEHK